MAHFFLLKSPLGGGNGDDGGNDDGGNDNDSNEGRAGDSFFFFKGGEKMPSAVDLNPTLRARP